MFASETMGKVIGLEDIISDMTGPQLVTVYNEMTGKSVKRFATRAAGIERVATALRKQPTRRALTTDDLPEEKPTAGVKRRRKFRADARKVRDYRTGTKRHKLIMILEQGATFERCMQVTGWTYKVCFEQIVLLNTYVGFGLSEDDEGVIRIHTGENNEQRQQAGVQDHGVLDHGTD